MSEPEVSPKLGAVVGGLALWFGSGSLVRLWLFGSALALWFGSGSLVRLWLFGSTLALWFGR